MRSHLSRAIVGAAALAAGLFGSTGASAMALTSQGSALGFTLSTFYSDPGAYYGALGVTTTADGRVIAASYARDQLMLLNNVDGQTPGSVLATASLSGYGSGYSVATAGGTTYFSPGFGGAYYSVNTITLALTPLALSTAVSPYLGLWGNPVTGHLLSSSSSGLVDIDPVSGSVHVVTSLVGFDGVTVSPDGKTAYAEYAGNIVGYDIASGAQVAFFSGGGHGPDGTGVISGGALNGDIVVNNNDGTVGLIDVTTGVMTIIADGGTRGDFVGPDWTNGTLFLANADQVERLGLRGGSIGGGGTIGVPEPTTWTLAALALLGVSIARRRA